MQRQTSDSHFCRELGFRFGSFPPGYLSYSPFVIAHAPVFFTTLLPMIAAGEKGAD
jgi:hypothetical protein